MWVPKCKGCGSGSWESLQVFYMTHTSWIRVWILGPSCPLRHFADVMSRCTWRFVSDQNTSEQGVLCIPLILYIMYDTCLCHAGKFMPLLLIPSAETLLQELSGTKPFEACLVGHRTGFRPMPPAGPRLYICGGKVFGARMRVASRTEPPILECTCTFRSFSDVVEPRNFG